MPSEIGHTEDPERAGRISEAVTKVAADMLCWRHDFHRHPETAFQEVRTSERIADLLRSFDIETHAGIARTGVVGRLANGEGPSIALRADIDALDIEELNDLPYRSRHPGKMHACGHDGHTAMLLGAARALAATRRFQGTVYFVFQPAEENEGGGRLMVEEGLFARFPADRVFGMHNWPGLEAGHFALRPGPMMAAYNAFEVRISGRGTHAAMPHRGDDVIVAACQIVTALQSIVSRRVDPCAPAVVSITQIQGGSTWNIIPDAAVLRGCIRHFTPGVGDTIRGGIVAIATSIARAFGATAEVEYRPGYPALVNTAEEAAHAAAAAAEVVGGSQVDALVEPCTGSEDFAFMLNERPGCYVWLGNGLSQGSPLHTPRYDFNDDILPIGARYWMTLVERCLA